MKKLVVILMVSLMATSAFAVIDPDVFRRAGVPRICMLPPRIAHAFVEHVKRAAFRIGLHFEEVVLNGPRTDSLGDLRCLAVRALELVGLGRRQGRIGGALHSGHLGAHRVECSVDTLNHIHESARLAAKQFCIYV